MMSEAVWERMEGDPGVQGARGTENGSSGDWHSNTVLFLLMGLNCHDLSDMEMELWIRGSENVNIIKLWDQLKVQYTHFLGQLFLIYNIKKGNTLKSDNLYGNLSLYHTQLLQIVEQQTWIGAWIFWIVE